MKRILALLWLVSAVANVPAAFGQGCTYENQGYFEGQVVCQSGSEMKCHGGEWEQTGNPCYGSGEKLKVDEREANGPADVEMPRDVAVPEVPPIPSE